MPIYFAVSAASVKREREWESATQARGRKLRQLFTSPLIDYTNLPALQCCASLHGFSLRSLSFNVRFLTIRLARSTAMLIHVARALARMR
ncbi:hypothetical protein TSAR_015906 [Trichomalopsis sarcophagae]|uniref:Uncharacterized protein n=1 Tax=Trichomalopsis sarcophagae TaxID=543379 RepID=A0A232FGL8_9HYME|nr:hypothetical protein TSAR_015906 [Trichomalopsis sarcophagae]